MCYSYGPTLNSFEDPSGNWNFNSNMKYQYLLKIINDLLYRSNDESHQLNWLKLLKS